MSCKKPEGKERKANCNRGTISVMQHFMFAVSLETWILLPLYIEKFCGVTFDIKGATFFEI